MSLIYITVYCRVSDVNTLELEKLLEDVRNGVYPLTAFSSITQPPASRPRAVSPELADSVKSETPEPVDTETRLIVHMNCSVRKTEENPNVKNVSQTYVYVYINQNSIYIYLFPPVLAAEW